MNEPESKTLLGFWVYLMTDAVLFASFFAVYLILHGSTAGGPTSQELFSRPLALAETLILLTSSFTTGLAMVAAQQQKGSQITSWLTVTGLLGLTFIGLEVNEFSRLVAEGHGPQTNAFLSAFFGLVGLHGLHIAVGLLWLIALVGMVRRYRLTPDLQTKLQAFSLYWHFLDIIWIFIFTIVYLLGAR